MAKLSAALSTFAALVVVFASFRQWWIPTLGGGLPLKPWAKWMLAGVAVLLAASLILLAFSP